MMMESKFLTPCKVNVCSETGRLRAVLLHRPGKEIERMTPLNAAHALYSDILDKYTVDTEYSFFSGILERWTNVYYVKDVLEEVMKDDAVKEELVRKSIHHDQSLRLSPLIGQEKKLTEQLLDLSLPELARILIEGYENPSWDGSSDDRYLLNPLYNLLFTRDASSTVYHQVLINSMSFEVRERESLIFSTIFKHFFKVDTFNASSVDAGARTEGGDVQVASPDLLCLGYGIRTNSIGIEYLAEKFAKERPKFNILVQELPLKPESFIHLDMVFTFLGQHSCMAFEPMLKKVGLFANKDTTLISIDNGRIKYRRVNNLLAGLQKLGWEMEPVLCGGHDSWVQLREQWHSGANFFALGDQKIVGYRRNIHTIDALNKAGFSILHAEDIVSGKTNMNDYDKFVAVFPGAELPRAGGGARCMTMPIWREA